jgi:dienelactone hydrolase
MLGSTVRADPLPGTEPLSIHGDFAMKMVAGIDMFLMRELDREPAAWKRDYRSVEAYAASIAKKRARLLQIIGAVDPRRSPVTMAYVSTTEQPAVVATGAGFTVHTVRWPVLDGVDGEGLLLEPDRPPVAQVIALLDADITPEAAIGLADGVPIASQFARTLAENGCRVVVPVLVDRRDTWSGNPAIGKMTNQPHREYVYRQAFELGRHIIGYEVQNVSALVDWFGRQVGDAGPRIGVIGHGEGGLLALYAGAADPRIDAVAVGGYFDDRQRVWSEPIYRNVWSLLRDFGDAELASLIAPRRLVIEACAGPEIDGPPTVRSGRGGAAPGKLTTPELASVRAEVARARVHYDRLGVGERLDLVVSDGGRGPYGTEDTLKTFLASLGITREIRSAGPPPTDLRETFDPSPRARRWFDQLCAFNQALLRQSEKTRDAFWSKADRTSVESWEATCTAYRKHFAEEVIGAFDPPSLPANPRTRLLYDTSAFRGYEVLLDVWPDVFAYGILLVPKDIRPGERRPVVVCQHGLEGKPTDVADPSLDNPYYHRYAAKLAERGFVTYAPQNPYIGRDKFRVLQRKANPIGRSLFSVIVRQHERTLEFLKRRPFVDPERIGFYGLSYGGKTAMRVPALVKDYCLSICSADFNEWIVKNTTTDARYSYIFTGEYEMFEFGLGETFNYAEMAGLIAPRPFMVERGHDDGVAPDEWVAYEYAKVRRLYVKLGLADRTEIEFFDGPHTINGQGTFDFLGRHLDWPKRE